MSYIGSPWKPGTTQVVAYTGTAGTIANATDAQTSVIRVVLTTAGHILISSGGTAATTSDVYMPAGVPEYFLVHGAVKVSGIQVAAGGNLHVTEMFR